MREEIEKYRKRVAELCDHVKGNEQATKQGLIGPLLAILGYDLSDPRECMPEYKADFGRDRSAKPVDWAFFANARPIFFVEAKDAGKKLPGYDEQLGDYFAKVPDVSLGILTNGVQWRFYTDLAHQHIMDTEPFLEWNVLVDKEPPYDLLTLLQKSQFQSELIRAYARSLQQKNLLVSELTRLLEPSPEFIKLAIANVETRNLTAGVVESWRGILCNAINEWAHQRAVTTVLATQSAASSNALDVAAKPVTTQAEMDTFEAVKRLLGDERPVKHLDTLAYFKIHLPEKHTWTFCRVYARKKALTLAVPLAVDAIMSAVPTATINPVAAGWTGFDVVCVEDIERYASILRSAYDKIREDRSKGKADITDDD